jgi:Cu+-exporting ATPase
LILASALTLPLFIQHFLHMVPAYSGSFLDLPWVQFAICLPVFLIGFVYFGKSSYNALLQSVFHMDLLIFIGSTSAFVYSLIGAIIGNPDMLFFETSAMIITLVLLGNYIEQRTVKRTQSAIEALKKLQVDTANRIKSDGSSETIPVGELKTDDIVIVNQGDTFPADGIILSGETYVDESMITGESDPIHKDRGDEVIGATLSSTGSVRVQIMRTGSDTILQRMIELVKRAQQEKPPVQRLADKISGIFVPVVIGISVLTFLLSYGLRDIGLTQSILNSIAVLVISCPCAMGLATPTAIAAGVGRMSRLGILLKSGRILELFAKTQSFIFDKTGTLTTGEFRIVSLESEGPGKDEIRGIIYQLEQHSSHPIAKALIAELGAASRQGSGIAFEQVSEIKGMGMEGLTKEGTTYFFGTKESQEGANKQLILKKDGELLATLTLEDELRLNTREAINELKSRGLKISILSGDNRENVARIAREIEPDHYHFGKKPEEKYAIIEQSSKSGVVAMVGDGINDAAALNKADIGISLSKASNIAINAADIVLMKQDLNLIPEAYKVSRATLTTIKQNLFWAFSYNLVAIPMAALGFLNPMWGALFMTFSDIVVVGNSVRLLYRKIR